MRHILVLDDDSKQSKAFLEMAKVLTGVKVLTETQWEKIEDKYTAHKNREGFKICTRFQGRSEKSAPENAQLMKVPKFKQHEFLTSS